MSLENRHRQTYIHTEWEYLFYEQIFSDKGKGDFIFFSHVDFIAGMCVLSKTLMPEVEPGLFSVLCSGFASYSLKLLFLTFLTKHLLGKGSGEVV